MKVAIITAIWKRPEVWEMFKRRISNLKKIKGLTIEVCVAGSEDWTEEACKGFHYVHVPNDPLGRKMNAAALLAKDLDVTHYLMVGSDDLIGNDLMKLYMREKDSADYLYLLDCWFFDVATKKGLYWGGYDTDANRGHACGAGRLFNRSLMDKLNFQPWHDERLSTLLDTSMNEKLARISHTRKRFHCLTERVFMVDIKSSTNMTPFAKWHNTMVMSGKFLFNYLPETEAKQIYE